MYWFDNFDPFEGDVPDDPIFDAPSIAFQARKLLDGCTREDARLLEYAIDDAVEAMRTSCLDIALDDLAKDIFQNPNDEVSGLLSDAERATVNDVRKTLKKRQGTSEYPLLPEMDDVSELDALYMAVISGGVEEDPGKCFALLSLSFLASYVDSVSSPDSDWEHVDMPVNVARLTRSANDAVYAAMALRQATRFSVSAEIQAESETNMQVAWRDEVVRRRKQLAISGSLGAKAKHEKTAKLKAWALEKAADMRDQDIDIARKLSAQLPIELADVSKNAERLIYDALRARNKPD